MGGERGTGASSDQDAHCGREPKGRVRLPGVSLRARHEMASPEEPGKVERSHSGEDTTQQRAEPEPDSRQRESYVVWLVWLLQAKPARSVRRSRQLDT